MIRYKDAISILSFVVLILAPSTIRILNEIINYQQLIAELMLEIGATMFAGIMVIIILNFQLSNPFCSSEAFKVIYWLLFWTMSTFCIFFIIGQILSLLSTKEIVWPMYFMLGGVIALYMMKTKLSV